MWRLFIHRYPTLGLWYQRLERRPSWVWKATVLAAVLVIGVPLVLVTLAALLVAAVVFAVLSLVAAGLATLSRLLGGGLAWPRRVSPDDGRRNVRVLRR